MDKGKAIFLLSKAIPIEPTGGKSCYDETQQLNVYLEHPNMPVVLDAHSPTHSKTFQAPCDDDPDRGIEKCY